LEDHTDSTTYYVRAVIRNARTDALIDTLNLTDNGSRRFTKSWLAPADPTGLGLDILVTYTVYTDSGYTTKAENYGERFDEHTVLTRIQHGGGGGADVDYKKVRKIIQEELAGLPKPLPFPEMPNIPFYLQPVLNALSGLRKDLQAIDIPTPDFSGVEYRLGLIESSIKAIPKDDDSAVRGDLEETKQKIEDAKQTILQQVSNIREEIAKDATADTKVITGAVDKVTKQLSGFEEKFDAQPIVVFKGAPQIQQKEEVEPIDFQSLIASRR
jgi:hypothetical protein